MNGESPTPAALPGGEMAALIQSMDWSTSPLGSRESWPQSLRTAVSICLQSKFPILIWWGPQFVMLYNDAYRPMLGTKHPRSMGQPGSACWAEIWHIIGPMLQGVMERGEATWSEDQMLPLARYGFVEECYFTFSYSPIQDESGGIGGVFSAISETTERVIGERRLNTLRALSVAGKHASAAAACAEAARVFDANPNDLPFALIYLTESDGETAVQVGAAGTPPREGLSPPTVRLQTGGRWPIAEVLRTGRPVTVAGATLGIDHTVALFPIAAPGRDEPTGVLVADISTRRPYDDGYQSFLGLVAGHIAAAVASARALEAERKRAEALAEIDRAKTAFFSNVSHEFRTPLTLMLGPLEEVLARRGDVPLAHVHEQLQVTRRNSLRLLKLVNTLLDFSRLEAGRLRARYEPVDLAGFTAELSGVFQAAIEKAGLRLRVACAPLSEPAYVDRDMWEKIVFNLLSNALKFTLQGEISVAVARREDQFELIVRDTGVGIPADELPNLFKRFHRIENIRSRTHEGTGIGLALVQELAKLHGGTVDATSRPGQGSTFTVRIPAGRDHLPREHVLVARTTAPDPSGDHAAATNSRIKAESFSEEALRWLPTAPPFPMPAAGPVSAPVRPDASAASTAVPRLVLADDNADMRDYVRRLLGDAYHVDAFADGEAALTAIRARRPDLVLTDVMMPRLDGVGLLRAIRADAVLSDLPVIMLSARAGNEASAEGLDAGADDYVIKPFTARELRARVRSHLQMAELRRAVGMAAERERRRLYDILSRAPAIVCVLRGPEHVFELANDHYVELVGRRSPSELLGKPIRAALPEVRGQGFFGLLDRVFATGEPFVGKEMRIRLQRSSGVLEEVIVNFVYQPTRDLDGRIDGILVHATDITEMVQARETIGRHRQELEQLVDDRTAKLQQTIEQMEEFSYSVSHDLRSPVRAMQGYAEVLLEDYGSQLDDQGRELLERVQRASGRMDRLIQDLLTYSRISRREMKLEPVSLQRLIGEVTQQYPELQPGRAQIDVAPGLPEVLAHEPSLTQVVSNLLSNAVKFVAAPRRPTVRVGFERRGELVRVIFEDNGIGIPPEHRHRLFGMFERLHADQKYEGTGIGLAIVRKAIERMNGKVGMDSDGVNGSQFWFELAAAPGASPEPSRVAGGDTAEAALTPA